jgi:uncharacterized protein YndB with AHSA1/START domain
MDTTTDLALEVRRSYAATPERVFAAWTEAQALSAWFAPTADMTTIVHALDVRVGGHFRIEMRAPSGATFITSGTYTEVVPGRRLAFTWQWEGQDEQTDVSVDLSTADGHTTELLLRHTRFATAASRDGHSDGWHACCARMSHTF